MNLDESAFVPALFQQFCVQAVSCVPGKGDTPIGERYTFEMLALIKK